MPTARKTDTGKWTVLAHVGKNITPSGYKRFTRDTKREAEAAAAAYTEERAKPAAPSVTVGQAIDRYIESKTNVLSPSTIRQYRVQRSGDLQELMDVPVDDLTQEQIQRAVNSDSAVKSPKSLRNAHGLLSAALRVARPDFALHTTLPQKRKTQIVIPTKAEVDRMLGAAKPDHDLYLAVMLASHMGLRRSEICALTPKDIEGDYLNVCKAVVLNDKNAWVGKGTKSYAGTRRLKIPKSVMRVLKHEKGERLISSDPNEITQRFETLLAREGIGKCRFHDLRHYYASVLLSLGVPDKYAMERMGHETDHMLKTVYQHTMSEQETKIDSKIEKYF